MRLATSVLLVALGCGVALAQDEEGLPPPARGARIDVAAEARAARAGIEALTARDAEQVLGAAYERLWQLDPAAIDFERIDRDPTGAVQALFDVSLALDDRMAALHARGQLSDAIANAKRRLLRALRYLRERVILRTAERDASRLAFSPAPAIAGTALPGFDHYHWTVNPAYRGQVFDADHLPRTFFILNEGDMTLSAAISRATSEDNMFSHYSVGYVSDREHTIKGTTYPAGTVFTIEALIEQGVVINPFPFHFNEALLDWSVREAIFFLRDPAQQAAVDAATDAFFARARDAVNSGRPLGYDFTMGHGSMKDALAQAQVESRQPPRLIDMDRFFCSGVADAIGAAAGVELFTNRSLMENSHSTRELVRSWGLDPDEQVTTPGDGDVSATLVRVAEGLAIEDTLVTHYRHAILNAMFRWMDEDGYQITAPDAFKAGVEAATSVNDKVAFTPLDLGLVPNGITPAVMGSLVPMHLAAQKFLKRMREHDDAALAESGRRLTPRELDAWLDEVRPEVNVDMWFVPGALGDYALTVGKPFWWSKGGTVTLQVTRGEAGALVVTRERTRDDGSVERGSGVGVQDGLKLKVEFSEREGGHPRKLTYRLGRDGSVCAWLGAFTRERGARRE